MNVFAKDDCYVMFFTPREIIQYAGYKITETQNDEFWTNWAGNPESVKSAINKAMVELEKDVDTSDGFYKFKQANEDQYVLVLNPYKFVLSEESLNEIINERMESYILPKMIQDVAVAVCIIDAMIRKATDLTATTKGILMILLRNKIDYIMLNYEYQGINGCVIDYWRR